MQKPTKALPVKSILGIPLATQERLNKGAQKLLKDFPPGRDNIAPTQPVPVIRQNPKELIRHLSLIRWGLIPSRAKDSSVAASMINARSETAATKPAFRDPLRFRRCLIPTDAFYEWSRIGKTKEGDPYPRPLLVQGAHHVLGPFGADSDLRRWGLKLAERGRKNRKKRAIIAVARKLAVLLHRLPSGNTPMNALELTFGFSFGLGSLIYQDIVCDENYVFWALRHIKKGTELTVDSDSYSDHAKLMGGSPTSRSKTKPKKTR